LKHKFISPSLLEYKVYGIHACQALFEFNPHQIVRVYVVKSKVPFWGEMLKWCAAQKKTYHLLEEAEMEKVAGTLHHEGICVLRKSDSPLRFPEDLKTARELNDYVLFLVDVTNPHNLGACLRSAAHFGFHTVLVNVNDSPSTVASKWLNGAVARNSMGALERLKIYSCPDVLLGLKELKKHQFTAYATSSHSNALSIYQTKLAPKSVLCMGAEGQGLPKKVVDACDQLLCLPGSGMVESLNVSVAAGCLMSEFARVKELKS